MSEEYIALIPAYEPGQIFIDLLLQLRAYGFHIVVADDGSGPDYSCLFGKASLDAVILTT